MTTLDSLQTQRGLPTEAGKACPFLGLADDATTNFAYPSAGNYCYRSTPPLRVCLPHQSGVCLGPGHTACPVFAENWRGPLPQGLCDDPARPAPWARRLSWLLVIALVTVLAGAALLLGNGAFLPAVAAESSPTPLPATLPPSSTPFVPLPSATQTAISPSPTAAPTSTVPPTTTPVPPTDTPAPPTPGPAWSTPFGLQSQYLLHQVRPDESVGMIADFYQTTTEVIVQTNQLPDWRPIQPGDVLVILPGQTLPSGLVPFRAVQVGEGSTVTAVAQEYQVSVEEVRQYNALGPGEALPAGRWLIIPVTGP